MRLTIDSKQAQSLNVITKKINQRTYLRIGAVIKSDMAKNFKNEEDPSGKKWKPLSKSTLKSRKKKGKGAKILKDTGFLLGQSFVTTPSINGVEIGFTADYAPAHEYGTKKIPRRRLLPESVDEIDFAKINKIILMDLIK